MPLISWDFGFFLASDFSGFEMVDRTVVLISIALCDSLSNFSCASLYCAASSLHGRPVNMRDWRLLKVTAAQLSAEVNRVECDWSGHLSSSIAVDLESISNNDEGDSPAPNTADEM